MTHASDLFGHAPPALLVRLARRPWLTPKSKEGPGAAVSRRAAAKLAAPRKKEKPPEEKPPAPQRDGLAALREAAKRRR